MALAQWPAYVMPVRFGLDRSGLAIDWIGVPAFAHIGFSYAASDGIALKLATARRHVRVTAKGFRRGCHFE